MVKNKQPEHNLSASARSNVQSNAHSTATIEETLHVMLKTHPNPAQRSRAEVMQCIEACIACAAACTACADACLAEDHVHDLVSCISMNTDCADICRATGQVLMRQVGPDWEVKSKQLAACGSVCARCAAECEQHAEMHEHCRVCAEICRHCEQACDQLLKTLPA
jgi:hypothetical protein